MRPNSNARAGTVSGGKVSRGDAYDNALAETVIGLFKTEVIRRRGPWRSLEAVEFAALDWVDWFNTRRLLEPSATCRRPSTKHATMSRPQWLDSRNSPSDDPGTVHSPYDLVRRTLMGGTSARYNSTGHIIFAREASRWAVPFDAGRLAVTGSPVPVLEGVSTGAGGDVQFSLVNDGTLIYVPYVPATANEIKEGSGSEETSAPTTNCGKPRAS